MTSYISQDRLNKPKVRDFAQQKFLTLVIFPGKAGKGKGFSLHNYPGTPANGASNFWRKYYSWPWQKKRGGQKNCERAFQCLQPEMAQLIFQNESMALPIWKAVSLCLRRKHMNYDWMPDFSATSSKVLSELCVPSTWFLCDIHGNSGRKETFFQN